MPPFVFIKDMMDSERLFLNVRKSATGQKWVDRLGLREANTALAIAQNHGIHDLVARVLAGRGVSLDGAAEFIDPTIRNLMPDPLTLTDMDKARDTFMFAQAQMRPGEFGLAGGTCQPGRAKPLGQRRIDQLQADRARRQELFPLRDLVAGDG